MRVSCVIQITLALLLSPPVFAADANSRWLPDPDATPGAANPDITQANIAKTICNAGKWSTKSIRPPASYTTTLKKSQLADGVYARRFKDKTPSLYEEDHLISIELGGHPRSEKNLWPQPWDGKYGAHAKDKVENKLHRLVCDGTLSLHQAQRMIADDWILAYQRYVQ